VLPYIPGVIAPVLPWSLSDIFRVSHVHAVVRSVFVAEEEPPVISLAQFANHEEVTHSRIVHSR
jgi:hypothetical protein